MRELRGIDLKRACLVPSSVFASPEEVAGSERLSLAQKLTILRRWEFDARRVSGLGSGPSMLREVEMALEGLGAKGQARSRADRRGGDAPTPLRAAAGSSDMAFEAGVAARAASGTSRRM